MDILGQQLGTLDTIMSDSLEYIQLRLNLLEKDAKECEESFGINDEELKEYQDEIKIVIESHGMRITKLEMANSLWKELNDNFHDLAEKIWTRIEMLEDKHNPEKYNEVPKTEGMTFGEALEQLKLGKTISRFKHYKFRFDDLASNLPRVNIIGMDEEIGGYWTPSLKDMESNDWRIVEDGS